MSEAQRDEVVPRGAWQFDQEVTAVFDDMLQRSIPQYNAMRMVTFEVGRRFVQPGTAIIDMGCSRGQALMPDDIDDDYLAQMESEQRVKEKGQWMWKQIGSRPNHYFDAEAEQAAAATMLKIVGRESVAAQAVDTPEGES